MTLHSSLGGTGAVAHLAILHPGGGGDLLLDLHDTLPEKIFDQMKDGTRVSL